MRNYHHIYATGYWGEPLAEHLDALIDSGFDGELRVGIVGESTGVIEYLNFAGYPYTICALADDGWEHVTLEALRAELGTHNDPILYTHTKGASVPSDFNTAWRRSMTSALVGQWRACVHELERQDLVGCHWLTPGATFPVDTPYFGGNFWWANPSYLRTLPPLLYHNRHEAEAWIGRGPHAPAVFDWTPGWPGWAAFAQEGAR